MNAVREQPLRILGRILVAALVLLVLWFIIWFNFILEWREETYDSGFSEEAYRNRFLAAQMFLGRAGIDSEQRYTLALLAGIGDTDSELERDDTLILIESFGVLYGDRLAEILTWVSRGGTLILSSRNEFFGDPSYVSDGVFESLGVMPLVSESPNHHPYDAFSEELQQFFDPDEEAGKTGIDNSQESAGTQTLAEAFEDMFEDGDFLACFNDSPITTWQAGNSDEELSAQFLGDIGLVANSDEPADIITDDRGLQLYSVAYGDGTVVLTTDNQLWSNYRIGCYDHAHLLYLLAGGGGKVWFLSNFGSASLITLLWRNFAIALIFLGLCLLGWLRFRGIRFGPVLDRETFERRSLLEHTDAAANFLYRRGRAAALIADLQRELLRRADLRYRGFSRLEKAQQVEILQEMTQCPAAVATLALEQRQDITEFHFQEQVKACQFIRMRL